MTLERNERYNKIATLELAIATLFSGGAYVLSLSGNTVVRSMLIISLIVTVAALNKHRFRIKLNRYAKYIFSVAFFVLLSTVYNISSFSAVVSGRCLLSIVIAIGIAVTFSDKKAAIETYINVIVIYSFIALIMWTLFVPLGISSSGLPLITSNSNSNVSYNTMILYNLSRNSTRNCGPFWEPSIFAGYITLALVFLRLQGKPFSANKAKYFVLLVALLTTQSSGGILLLLLFVTLCVWNSKGKQSDRLIVKMCFVAIFGLMIIGWSYLESFLLVINYAMFSKIFSMTENGSSLTRLQSVIVDFHIFLSSPVFGVGVDKLETEFLRLRDVLATVTGMAHTSTSTEYLAAFGIGGVWLNYLWIKSVWSYSKNTVTGILLILIIFIILNIAPQINSPLTYFVLFFLLQAQSIDSVEDLA